MGFVCEEVKEGDFLLSAQHLRDAFGECSVSVCPPLQKNPNQTSSLLQQQQDTDFPEGVQGRPWDAQGPAIKETLIKYRTEVSRVVNQQHREPEGLCQRSPWLWAGAWTKILQRMHQNTSDIPTPLVFITKLPMAASFCSFGVKPETQRSKGIPTRSSRDQNYFQSHSCFKEIVSHVVLPQYCFPTSRNFHINTKMCSIDKKLHFSPPCCRMSLSNVTALKANNPTHLMCFISLKPK